MDYLWVILAIVTQSALNPLEKAGMLKVGQSPQNLRKLPRFLLRTFSNPFVVSGVVLNILFVPFYTLAIASFPVSYVYPLLVAMPMVGIVIFSLIFFKEKVTRMSWLGIATICVGVVLLGIAMG